MLDVNEPYFNFENLGIKGSRYIELEKLYNNKMIKTFSILLFVKKIVSDVWDVLEFNFWEHCKFCPFRQNVVYSSCSIQTVSLFKSRSGSLGLDS